MSHFLVRKFYGFFCSCLIWNWTRPNDRKRCRHLGKDATDNSKHLVGLIFFLFRCFHFCSVFSLLGLKNFMRDRITNLQKKNILFKRSAQTQEAEKKIRNSKYFPSFLIRNYCAFSSDDVSSLLSCHFPDNVSLFQSSSSNLFFCISSGIISSFFAILGESTWNLHRY